MQMILPMEELAARQSFAAQMLQEMFCGWWIEHHMWCGIDYGEGCCCGQVLWFRGVSKVIGVHSGLIYEMHPVH